MTGSVHDANQSLIDTRSPTYWEPSLESGVSLHENPNTSKAAVPIVTLVAIGMGCAVAGIGLGVLAWKLLFRRKRLDWAQELAEAREEYANHQVKSETARSAIPKPDSDDFARQELDSKSRQVYELESPSKALELGPQPKKMWELP